MNDLRTVWNRPSQGCSLWRLRLFMRSHMDCLFHFRALSCALHSGTMGWNCSFYPWILYKPEHLEKELPWPSSLSLVQGKTIDICSGKAQLGNKKSSFLLGHSFSATVASACGTRLCACYIVSVSAPNCNNCEENSLQLSNQGDSRWMQTDGSKRGSFEPVSVRMTSNSHSTLSA